MNILDICGILYPKRQNTNSSEVHMEHSPRKNTILAKKKTNKKNTLMTLENYKSIMSAANHNRIKMDIY